MRMPGEQMPANRVQKLHLIAASCAKAHKGRHLPGCYVTLHLMKVAAEEYAGCCQTHQKGGCCQCRTQTGIL